MRDLTYPMDVRRILVRLEDGRWQVMGDDRVPGMTLPTALTRAEGAADGPVAGSYWEAVDADGEVLYRDYAEDLGLGMELFDADGSIRRTGHAVHDSTMELLVPALRELAGLRLVMIQHATSDDESGEARPEVSVLWLDEGRDPPKGQEGPQHEDEGEGSRGHG